MTGNSAIIAACRSPIRSSADPPAEPVLQRRPADHRADQGEGADADRLQTDDDREPRTDPCPDERDDHRTEECQRLCERCVDPRRRIPPTTRIGDQSRDTIVEQRGGPAPGTSESLSQPLLELGVPPLEEIADDDDDEERGDRGDDLLKRHAGTPLDRGSIRARRSRLSIPTTMSVAAMARSRLPVG